MTEDIQKKVVEIITKEAEIDASTLKPDSTLEELDIPSLTQIEIFFALEEAFDIDLPEKPGEPTLNGLVALIERLMQEK